MNLNYNKSGKTFTETLTKKEIEEFLEDYEKVNNINDIKLGAHLRYFTKKKNKMHFRLGGNLLNKKNYPKYVVLTNGKINWSVQVKNTIFYRLLSINEIKLDYEELLDECQKIIKKLKIENAKLKAQLKK